MTLIAAFFIDEIPVLVGDVLISRISGEENSNQPAPTIPLATVQDSYEVFEPGWGCEITGVCQKINIISENLVIAWAGVHAAANIVISELKRRSLVEKLNRNEIQTFFEMINSDINDWMASLEVAFIGYVVDQEGIHFFDYAFNGIEHTRIESPRYGSVTAYGTGASDLAEIILQSQRRVSEATDNLSAIDNAIIESLTICGFLFCYEMATSRTFYHFYGGAYEISIYIENRFDKLNDVTYLFWLLKDKGEENLVRLHPKGFKISYSDKVAFVSAFELHDIGWLNLNEQVDSIQFELIDEKIYPILPIGESVQEDKGLKIGGLNSKINCSYILNAFGKLPITCIPTKVEDIAENRIRFIYGKNDQALLDVDKRFLESLLEIGCKAINS